MKRLAVNGLLLLAILLPGSGCKVLKKPYPQQASYMLELPAPETAPLAGKDLVLHVHPVKVAPAYQGREFVYRRADGTVSSDFYNQFFQPPGVLLTELLRQWFAGPDMDPLVVSSTRPGVVTHGVHVRVRSLYGDYRQGPPSAVAELELVLTRHEGARQVPQFRQTYEGRQALGGEQGAAELVAGWNAALADILVAMTRDLESQSLRPWQAEEEES